jgi:hypothetical protein
MKKINKIVLLCSALLITFFSCKDESLEVIPEWGTAVNTFAKLKTGASSSFVSGNSAIPVTVNFRWISIDSKNTVTKVEFYILFNEGYVDADGNPKTVRHGGTAGKLLKTIEGAAVPANRTDVELSVTQAEIYNLYKDNTNNYCGTAVPVFNNTLKPGRTPSAPFLAGDSFQLKWTVYTEDGRKFDSWSPSVCNEFPGSNCVYAWSVVCASDLAGTYSYSTVVSAVGPGGVMPGGPLTGNGTLGTTTTTGSYTVPDVSFGVYGAVYSDTPAVGCRFSDACNLVTFTGSDQYGDVYSFELVSNDGTNLTFKWGNGYGDRATTTLTRTDAKTWPAGITSTPSGSCN